MKKALPLPLKPQIVLCIYVAAVAKPEPIFLFSIGTAFNHKNARTDAELESEVFPGLWV